MSNDRHAVAREIRRQASSSWIRRFSRSLDKFEVAEQLPSGLLAQLERLGEAEAAQSLNSKNDASRNSPDLPEPLLLSVESGR